MLSETTMHCSTSIGQGLRRPRKESGGGDAESGGVESSTNSSENGNFWSRDGAVEGSVISLVNTSSICTLQHREVYTLK